MPPCLCMYKTKTGHLVNLYVFLCLSFLLFHHVSDVYEEFGSIEFEFIIKESSQIRVRISSNLTR